ncbi:ankyrin repeat domain-containing protein 53-like [Acanthaster planci]|uniref:Ankyrin repeat domain-containing protein 53-like n=1 Tax=Acanthaster planci TaxID=133434 RepID=A0A8B7XKB9_ACAPL|nr:ankyrin repeat domain-containing protein 53-like [Acanthaster planci]
MCKSTHFTGQRASSERTTGSRRKAAAEITDYRGRSAPNIISMTELTTAVKKGDLSSVRRVFSLLTSEEAENAVRYQTPETRETLLFCACVTGQLETARFLLAMGRDQRDVCTAWGAVPLHAAAERCHEDIVRLLLKNGADMNAQTSYGDTPLHLAAFRGHYTTVRCLVEAGCDLHIVNSKGKTALDDASAARHQRIVQYLGAVMYPDTDDCARNHQERKMANDKIDLMKTRPLAPPIRTIQKLDRCISWHSCPSNILRGSCSPDEGARNSWQNGRRHSAASTVASLESSVNDLSMTTAFSPRRDNHRGMNVIPEVTNDTGNQRHQCNHREPRQEHAATPVTSSPVAARTCAEKRRDYRDRSASDSRVEYLEKMVEHLRQGLTATQEELGRTRVELRRANDQLQLPPCRMNTGDGPGCACGPKGTVRLVLNVRDQDLGHLY